MPRGSLAALLVALAVTLTPAAAPARAADYTKASCDLLVYAGADSLVTGGKIGGGAGPHEGNLIPRRPNGCGWYSCWQDSTDPDTGAHTCTYARAASLQLIREPTAKRAVALVRQAIRHGYHRLRGRADLAGGILNGDGDGGGVVLAVGRTFAVYALGAVGPPGETAYWPDVSTDLNASTKRVVRGLRRRGCPPRCPGTPPRR